MSVAVKIFLMVGFLVASLGFFGLAIKAYREAEGIDKAIGEVLRDMFRKGKELDDEE